MSVFFLLHYLHIHEKISFLFFHLLTVFLLLLLYFSRQFKEMCSIPCQSLKYSLVCPTLIVIISSTARLTGRRVIRFYRPPDKAYILVMLLIIEQLSKTRGECRQQMKIN